MLYTLQDGNGGTPLHYAVRAGSVEAVHAIMSRPKVSKIFLSQLSETEMWRSDSARKIKARASIRKSLEKWIFKGEEMGKGGSSLFFLCLGDGSAERAAAVKDLEL